MKVNKFRAMKYLTKEWVYGSIVTYMINGIKKYEIVPDYASALYGIQIIDETIGQFTGLHDKNGAEVYEGDLIKYHFGEEIARIKFGSYQSCFDSAKTEHIGFYVDWQGNMRKDLGYWVNMIAVEIIGNIHEKERKNDE